MRLTSLGHAAYVLEGDRGECVFFDPVLRPTHQEGLLAHYPERRFGTLPRPDAIVISHRHMDHFDAASLAVFSRATPVIIPEDPLLVSALERLGFVRIEQIAAGGTLQVGSVELTATPSLGPVPEMGILIRSDNQWIWNQVDTVIDTSIARAIADIASPDLALVRWQPLQDTLPFGLGSIQFPLQEYQAILESIAPLNAKAFALGACGFRYRGESSWLNHAVFPQSRTRAASDLMSYLGSTVWTTDPGMVFTVSARRVSAEVDASAFVQSASAWDDRRFALCPWHPQWPELPRAEAPYPSAIRLLDLILAWATSDAEAVEILRSWNIKYHIRIAGSVDATDLMLDFSEAEIGHAWAQPPWATYCAYIGDSVLTHLLTDEITWDRALLGGSIFRSGEAYLPANGDFSFPEAPLPDPLFGALGGDTKWLAAQDYARGKPPNLREEHK